MIGQYKTFADYLVMRGIPLSDDTVIVNSSEIALPYFAAKNGDEIRNVNNALNLPAANDFVQQRTIPVFDSIVYECGSVVIGGIKGYVCVWAKKMPISKDLNYTWFMQSTYIYQHPALGIYGNRELVGFDKNGISLSSKIGNIDRKKYDDDTNELFLERHALRHVHFPSDKDDVIILDNSKKSTALILWLAVTRALMHVRPEIELVTHPDNQIKRVKRKTGKEPSPYFLLRVDPTKPRKVYESSGNHTGQKNRAHIVRGHFRTTENHPIEQFNGTQWIPAHMRGDKNKGIVNKGYRIVLPEQVED